MPLGLAGIFVWVLWLYRAVLSRFARPVVNDFRTTVSVVVPAYREDPDILLECLDTWLAQDPDEVIIVPDVGGHRGAAAAGRGRRPAGTGAGVRAPRQALGARRRHPGRAAASSSCWSTPTPAGSRACSTAVQMPFVDPDGRRRRHPAERLPAHARASGGGSPTGWSTCATTTTCRRWAGPARWPACPAAPPRTAARRSCRCWTHLENEFFLGRRCVAGDDGRLTWLVLASGYKTVHQSSARALSMFPRPLRGVRQAAGAVEPQLVPLLPDRAVEGLAVARARWSPRSPCCRSC